jgi:flagellar hook-associated protein 1
MSTFSGLSTALSALYAQRRALEVTGQNIANANTVGYSRQRAEMAPSSDVKVPARYSTPDPASGGVEITSVSRLHDEFLDNRMRAERSLSTYLGGQKDVYARIEQVIGEPSDTGVQAQLSEFWASWHDIANRPSDVAARTQLLSRANTVADSMRGIHNGLSSLWSSTRDQLNATVEEVNQAAIAVADFNHRIIVANAAGLPTNEMADKRDQMVLKLTELTGATARPRTDGSVDVLINGSALVHGGDARALKPVGVTDMADQLNPTGQLGDPDGPVGVFWTDSPNNAGISGGKIASLLESMTTSITDASIDLDAVAAQFITAVNDQHRLGFDLDGIQGGNLFGGSTALSMSVLIDETEELAASSTPPDIDPDDGSLIPSLDGGNATALALIAKDPLGPDASYRTYVVDLGVKAQTVNRRADIQNTITQETEAARQAASGVSLDEEMTNMIQYQRAYEAAAKVMSVVDSTLDTLINGIKR